MKHLRVAVALAVAVTLGVAACGSPKKDNGNTGNNGNQGPQNVTVDPNAKGPAPDVAGFRKGGNILVYNSVAPTGFDPTDIYYTDSNEIGKLLYRTPTQFVIRNNSAVLVPDITDLGTVSPDKLTWTFKVKTHPKYGDGTEMKVEDLAYAIKRSFAHDIYANGPTYQLSYFKDHDTYKGPYTSGDTYAGVETPDADTLIIHLDKAFPDLPYYLTFPAFTPIPQAKDNREEYGNNPMATGPYMFDSYTPGSELKLKKNPFWDANTDPARHQYPDTWDFKWGEDDVKSQQAIVNNTGNYASAVSYANVDATLVDQVKGKADQYYAGDSPCTIIVNLDSRKMDLAVRKAIALAYPFDDIYKASGLNPDIAEPASTILPPAVPGFQKYTLPGLTGTGNGDANAAKAALTAAGKLGFEVSWYFNSDSAISQQVSDIRSDALKKAGFTTKPIGVPQAQLRAKTADYDAPVNLGQAPRGWCSDWPSGGSWFPVLFRTQSISDGTTWGFLSDSALDAKIDAVGDLPTAAQTAKWTELDKYIMETYLPVLPFYYDKVLVAFGNNLGGVTNDPTVGMPNMENMFVKS
jgi:peptide/nickel transport system substrate-binding protein